MAATPLPPSAASVGVAIQQLTDAVGQWERKAGDAAVAYHDIRADFASFEVALRQFEADVSVALGQVQAHSDVSRFLFTELQPHALPEPAPSASVAVAVAAAAPVAGASSAASTSAATASGRTLAAPRGAAK